MLFPPIELILTSIIEIEPYVILTLNVELALISTESDVVSFPSEE